MKFRTTEILSDEIIPAIGHYKEVSFPDDHNVNLLIITMVGQNITDEATISEITAGINLIEVKTKHGSPVKISGTDLYYFNRDFFGKIPYINARGEATDNQFRYISLVYPFNPLGHHDIQMGLSSSEQAKIAITMASDTIAGIDGRTITLTVMGIEGNKPISFMGMFQDSYTSIVGDQYRSIQSESVLGLSGIYAYQTTSLADITITNAPGIQKLGYAVAKNIKQFARISVLGAAFGEFNITDLVHNHSHTHTISVGASAVVADANNTVVKKDATHIEVSGTGTAITLTTASDTVYNNEPTANYLYFAMGAKENMYIPIDRQLQIYINHGVAEATRIYPMLIIANGGE